MKALILTNHFFFSIETQVLTVPRCGPDPPQLHQWPRQKPAEVPGVKSRYLHVYEEFPTATQHRVDIENWSRHVY